MRCGAVIALALAPAPVAAQTAAACPTDIPHYHPHATPPPSGAGYVTVDGAVRIVGYNDMAPMVSAWNAAFAAAHPGVRFAPELQSTRSGPPALSVGRSAFAPMGAAFTAQDLADFRAATGSEPVAIHVAHDSLDPKALSGPLGLMVARDNPMTAISLEQAARVFAASQGDAVIRTWGQLGLKGRWTARPVRPLGLAPHTALALFLQAQAFPGRPYTQELSSFGHSTDVVAALAHDPEALAFAAVNTASPEVRVLAVGAERRTPVLPTATALRNGRYPLDRRLLIYARRPLEAWVRDYLSLVLSCEGQSMVGAGGLGYLPLSAREMRGERRKLR
jgi:phosphate transport system substrate-binding protein